MLVGIGLEEIGAEEFVQEEFLAGEVYVDLKKQCYQDLGFKRQVAYIDVVEKYFTLFLIRFNWFSIFKALITPTSRRALSQVKHEE